MTAAGEDEEAPVPRAQLREEGRQVLHATLVELVLADDHQHGHPDLLRIEQRLARDEEVARHAVR